MFDTDKELHSFCSGVAMMNGNPFFCSGTPEFTVEELMHKRCCHRKHVTCFRRVSQEAIELCRNELYSGKSKTQQNQMVLGYMRQHSGSNKSLLYCVSGQKVCETCWRLTYGIRYNKFQSLKSKFESSVVLVEHGLTWKTQASEATLRLTSWMRSFFEKVGDRMPMCKELHLPSCLTKVDVYDLARDDLTQGGLSCCSASQMYELWKREFPHVKIPKVRICLWVCGTIVIVMNQTAAVQFSHLNYTLMLGKSILNM